MRLSPRSFHLVATVSIIMTLFAVLIMASPPARAATDTLSVTCNRTSTKGQVQIDAPYVRVQVVLASDLNQVIADKVVSVNRRGQFNANLRYARQPQETLLIVVIGEWDGQQYLAPAALTSRHCNPQGGTAPGGMTPTPTWIFTDVPWTPEPTWVPTTDPATPTWVPTTDPAEPTWAPTTDPTFVPSPTPIINYAEFYADVTSIPAGGCVTLSYWVLGASQLTLQGSNWLSGPEILAEHSGSRTVCPSAADGYEDSMPVTYTLGIVYLDGTTDSRTVTIQVAPAS